MLPGLSVLTTFRTTKWLPAPAASGERNGPLGLSLDAVQTEPLHALTFRSDPPSPLAGRLLPPSIRRLAALPIDILTQMDPQNPVVRCGERRRAGYHPYATRN